MAFNQALLETRRYMRQLESGAERSSEAENELSRLWNEAGNRIYEHDRPLANLCFIKGNGWTDESVWNDPRYRELPIRLNDMLERLLQATGTAAVDIVEGECRLDTITWRTRVPLPPFSTPPTIALWRADGGAASAPDLEKVTADFFTARIHSNDQAGTWSWRARGCLLR